MWRRVTFEESVVIRKAVRGEVVDIDKLREIGNKLTYLDMYRILMRYCPRVKIEEEKINSILRKWGNGKNKNL